MTLVQKNNTIAQNLKEYTQRLKHNASELELAAAAFATNEAILITDSHANILRVNQTFQRMTGYSSAEVVGQNPHILSSGRYDKSYYVAMWQQILSDGYWTGELWEQRKDGSIYP